MEHAAVKRRFIEQVLDRDTLRAPAGKSSKGVEDGTAQLCIHIQAQFQGRPAEKVREEQGSVRIGIGDPGGPEGFCGAADQFPRIHDSGSASSG